MKSSKNLIILLLALTTVGGALLAWRQYTELVELRAVALNRTERADLQKRIWDLEKSLREAQDQLLAVRAANPAELENLLATASADRSDENRRGRGGRDGEGRGRGGPPQFAALRELMNKPEVQAMVATQQKAAIENRYGALFKTLNLSPEQQGKLETLLAERQRTAADVFEAARSQGIDPRENPEEFRKLMTTARNDIEASIKSAIGDSAYEQLQSYERTMPQRGLVNEIQQRLAYTNTPLTATQAEQLVQILATNTPARPAPSAGSTTAGTAQPGARDGGWTGFRGPGGPDFGPGRGPDMGMLGAVMGGGPGGGMMLDLGRSAANVPVTDAAVNQAQTVLSQPQVAVLQQIQQQQQTQQQLAQVVRETLSTASQNQSPSDRGSTSGGSSTSQPPSRRRPGG